MTEYAFRRVKVYPGEKVDIPDGAIGVNIKHLTPPERGPMESFVEWLEPIDD